MNKQGKIRPAPYSHTDGAENQAVATFVSLLDHEKVKDDIKIRNTIPNIDENFTRQLKIVDGQKSKTIYYPKDNFVDGQNTRYIQAWKYITDVRKIKLQNYDESRKNQYSISSNR